MTHLAEFAGLFAAAFLAATVMPFQSEAVLAGVVSAERHPLWPLVVVASAGNVLGSIANWCPGRSLARLEGHRWFPVERERVAEAEGWYRRCGRWSLLLSWVPVIGDPLAVVAGVLRDPLPVFVVPVAVAKTGRYVAVAALADAWVRA